MGMMKIMKSDGTQIEEECPDIYEGQASMRARFREIVGGDIEHVHVLYEGKPKYMIVNESGAVQNPPLPVNKEASHIYHTASANREELTLEQAFNVYPKVHGDVALLVDCKVL